MSSKRGSFSIKVSRSAKRLFSIRESPPQIENRIMARLYVRSIMPRSHIHGSPRRFHYGLDLTDDPGNVIFCSPIRMHNGVATGFDLSTKDRK